MQQSQNFLENFKSIFASDNEQIFNKNAQQIAQQKENLIDQQQLVLRILKEMKNKPVPIDINSNYFLVQNNTLSQWERDFQGLKQKYDQIFMRLQELLEQSTRTLQKTQAELECVKAVQQYDVPAEQLIQNNNYKESQIYQFNPAQQQLQMQQKSLFPFQKHNVQAMHQQTNQKSQIGDISSESLQEQEEVSINNSIIGKDQNESDEFMDFGIDGVNGDSDLNEDFLVPVAGQQQQQQGQFQNMIVYSPAKIKRVHKDGGNEFKISGQFVLGGGDNQGTSVMNMIPEKIIQQQKIPSFFENSKAQQNNIQPDFNVNEYILKINQLQEIIQQLESEKYQIIANQSQSSAYQVSLLTANENLERQVQTLNQTVQTCNDEICKLKQNSALAQQQQQQETNSTKTQQMLENILLKAKEKRNLTQTEENLQIKIDCAIQAEKITNLMQELASLKTLSEERENELKQTLNKTIEEKDRSMGNLEACIQQIGLQAQNKISQISSSFDQLLSIQAELQAQKNQLDEKDKTIEQLRCDLQNQSNLCEDILQIREEALTNRKQLLGQISKSEDRHMHAEAKLQEELHIKKHALDVLQARYDDVQDQLVQNQKENERHQKDTQALCIQIQLLQEQNQSLKVQAETGIILSKGMNLLCKARDIENNAKDKDQAICRQESVYLEQANYFYQQYEKSQLEICDLKVQMAAMQAQLGLVLKGDQQKQEMALQNQSRRENIENMQLTQRTQQLENIMQVQKANEITISEQCQQIEQRGEQVKSLQMQNAYFKRNFAEAQPMSGEQTASNSKTAQFDDMTGRLLVNGLGQVMTVLEIAKDRLEETKQQQDAKLVQSLN